MQWCGRVISLAMVSACGFIMLSVIAPAYAQNNQPEAIPDPPPSVNDYSLPPGPSQAPVNRTQGPVEEGGAPPQSAPQPNNAAPNIAQSSIGSPSSAIPVIENQRQPNVAANSRQSTSPAGRRTNPAVLSAPRATEALDASPRSPGSEPVDILPSNQSTADTSASDNIAAIEQGGSKDGAGSSNLIIFGIILFLLGTLAVLIWRRSKKKTAPQAIVAQKPKAAPSAKTVPQSARKPAPTITVPPNSSPNPAPKPSSNGFVTTKINAPAKQSQPAPPPATPTPPQSDHLHIALAPEKISSTLLNAVLSYSVTITNRNTERTDNIRLSGAMVQADNEAATNGIVQPDTELHLIESLGAGESIILDGEMRLPLSAIRPILFRTQSLFIPLARFAAQYSDSENFIHYQTASFIIGHEHQPPRAKLAPFRLDLGLRNLGPIGQRPLIAS